MSVATFSSAQSAQSADSLTKPEQDATTIRDLLLMWWHQGRLPWVKAADIVRALWPELADDAKRMEDGKRAVRRAVETTDLIVSAPGSAGYALRQRISPQDEIEVCNARLSQARKNFRKAWRARKEAMRRMTPDLTLTADRTAALAIAMSGLFLFSASPLLPVSKARAFDLEWERSCDPMVTGYVVRWADNAQLTAPAVVQAGTATKLWIPNPPAGVCRFATVTALGTAQGVSGTLESLPSRVAFFPSAKWIVDVTPNLNGPWSSGPAMVTNGTDGAVRVAIPATGSSGFIRLRKE